MLNPYPIKKETASLITRDGISLAADIYRPDSRESFPIFSTLTLSWFYLFSALPIFVNEDTKNKHFSMESGEFLTFFGNFTRYSTGELASCQNRSICSLEHCNMCKRLAIAPCAHCFELFSSLSFIL